MCSTPSVTLAISRRVRRRRLTQRREKCNDINLTEIRAGDLLPFAIVWLSTQTTHYPGVCAVVCFASYGTMRRQPFPELRSDVGRFLVQT